MTIQTQSIEYYDNGVLLEGFLAYDDHTSVQRPAVLIAHTWAGRDTAVCNKAIQLAESGYVGFAADLYGKGILGTCPDENSRLMQPFIDNRGRLQARMIIALETLRQQQIVDPTKVAALGYCFGGMCVLDLARTGIQFNGAISVHGLLQAPDNVNQADGIDAKILVLHGHQDPLAPKLHIDELQQELTSRQADWQLHLYGNTMHAFTNPLANDPDNGIIYNPVADKRSWLSIMNFLNELFG